MTWCPALRQAQAQEREREWAQALWQCLLLPGRHRPSGPRHHCHRRMQPVPQPPVPPLTLEVPLKTPQLRVCRL